eukprot:9468086-Pyramimonas_sp.AAC.1
MKNQQSRSSIEPRTLNSACCPSYSYCPNHLDKCSQFSVLKCWGRATVLRVIDIDLHTSGASVGRFQSSKLGLLLEL